MTQITTIHSDDDLTAALARIDALWGADQGTPDGDELDALFDLVEQHEDQAYPTPADLKPSSGHEGGLGE